jgi:hypothetical protein
MNKEAAGAGTFLAYTGECSYPDRRFDGHFRPK